jgi:hypothetical protein
LHKSNIIIVALAQTTTSRSGESSTRIRHAACGGLRRVHLRNSIMTQIDLQTLLNHFYWNNSQENLVSTVSTVHDSIQE